MIRNNATREKFVPGPVQQIKCDWGHNKLFIKRLDLIQSWADGNKYYKLKNNIAFALDNNIKTIVSKGGMFSNHLYSLAHACAHFKIELICVIRSYEADMENPTIKELRSLSKDILFLTPEKYTQFGEVDATLAYPDSMFIAEGGMGERAIHGIGELMNECLTYQPTHIIVSGGSMATACGLIASALEDVKVIVVPAWKGCKNEFIENKLMEFEIPYLCDWELWPDAHFGGFARYDRTLSDFMYSFTMETGIPLDPIYTGKMMYVLSEKIKSGYFKDDDSILAIHTGGLQGVRGFGYRYPEDWKRYEDLIFMND
ncbi:MAG: pyridoxal-phosphate dependent enzyme [Saprospiraceae bacterium]